MTPSVPPTALPLPEPVAHGVPRLDTRRTRRAVLAGVGEARNDPSVGLTDAVSLAAEAARAAAEDAGDPGILGHVGLIAATVGSDDAPDPAGAVRELLGLSGARTVMAPIGVSQQRLVSIAILAVETGLTDAVLVLGGEAKASALVAGRHDQDPPEVPQGPGADERFEASAELLDSAEVAAHLWDPVAQYALIDSALARHEGRGPSELLAEVSELWARFDSTATANHDALFAAGRDAAELAHTTEANRLLAFPYNKWHSTQWALDHAAALIVCTEDVARRHGASEDRFLFPLVALDSTFALSLARRAEPWSWPAMRIMGHHAGVHLDGPLGEVADLLELYSCFPAAVRVQQRELGLAADTTPTITGGMAFAGGPYNHFTYMVTAALARQLRACSDEAVGTLTTVSGLLTTGGIMAWGREPHAEGALVADVADEARAATAAVPVEAFDPDRGFEEDDEVLAATITGGLAPRLFALLDDTDGRRRVVATEVPEGEPAEVLSGL